MGNQQLRRKQRKVQRLSLLRGVHCKRLAVEVVSPKVGLSYYGKDIVCAAPKGVEVHERTVGN